MVVLLGDGFFLRCGGGECCTLLSLSDSESGESDAANDGDDIDDVAETDGCRDRCVLLCWLLLLVSRKLKIMVSSDVLSSKSSSSLSCCTRCCRVGERWRCCGG